MRFHTINELNNFSFEDCRITQIKWNDGDLVMELEGLIVLPKNSQNERYQKSYAGIVTATFTKAQIEAAVKDGYKHYDADGNLTEEIPYQRLNDAETEELYESLPGVWFYDVQPIEELTDGSRRVYMFGIEMPRTNEQDLAEITDTYELRVSFEDAVLGWDRYMNKAE